MKTFIVCFALFSFQLSCAPIFGSSCSGVMAVSNSHKDWIAIVETINKYMNKYRDDNVSISKVYVMNSIDNWYVVAVEFDKLDSGIFSIEKSATGFSIIKELSGNLSENGNTAEFISNYFKKNTPSAPRELFDCSSQQIAKFW